MSLAIPVEESVHRSDHAFRRFLAPHAPSFAVFACTSAGACPALCDDLMEEGWEVSLLPSVIENDHALERLRNASCGLFVTDAPARAVAILRELFTRNCRPSVVITRDENGHAPRAEKYAFLCESGYSFCGLAGEDSIWSASQSGALPLPPPASALPASLRDFTAAGPGRIALDWPRTGPETTVHLDSRADLRISGWAIADPAEPVPEQLYVRVRHDQTGVDEYLTLVREKRPDVVDCFSQPGLLWSGFHCDLSSACRRWGVHSVSFVQAGGGALYDSGPVFRFAIRLQDYEASARVGVANRYLHGSGIEIGALQKAAKVSGSCSVRYVDRMKVEELLQHYPEMAGLPLQAPDIVDNGETLSHIASDSQDFVIANHFFEHCQNPIQTLSNLLRVIKPGGVLFMAVPDKRHTFDLKRPVTSYAVLRETYQTGARADRTELFFEWTRLVYNLAGEEADARAREQIAGNYSIHFNVWTTPALLEFLAKAREEFDLPFEMLAAVSAENEVIVILERTL